MIIRGFTTDGTGEKLTPFPEGGGGGGGGTDTDDQLADEVPYDNTGSGLAATDVQGAIDEIAADCCDEGAESDGGESLATEILADSPTGYWKCDETSGSAINDSSGNGFHMTVVGAPNLAYTHLLPNDSTKFLQCPTGNNGASITSVLGTSPPLSGDYTIECVVMPLDLATTVKMFSIGGGAGETEAVNMQTEFRISTSPILGAFWEHSTGTDDLISSGIVIAEAVVYHAVMVKDGTANTLTFYINGRKVNVASYANEPTGGSSGQTARIGYDAVSATGELVIGHVAFYNGQKLSEARIRAHADAAGLTT